MNKGVFLQKLKYHYKKYLSITFASIGLALLVGAIAYLLIANRQDGHSVFGSIWNYLILLVSFIFILCGTVSGTTLAYSGILMFVFYILWDFGDFILVFLVGNGSFKEMFGNSVWSILYNVGFLFGSIAAFVLGILLYIRLRQFLIGKYVSYVGLRNLALAFMILAIIFNGFFPMLMLIAEPSLKVFLALLCPFAVIFEALASFFTVTRLKSEY